MNERLYPKGNAVVKSYQARVAFVALIPLKDLWYDRFGADLLPMKELNRNGIVEQVEKSVGKRVKDYVFGAGKIKCFRESVKAGSRFALRETIPEVDEPIQTERPALRGTFTILAKSKSQISEPEPLDFENASCRWQWWLLYQSATSFLALPCITRTYAGSIEKNAAEQIRLVN